MLMWDRGLTQTKLGDALGIDQPSLGKRLRGARGWSLDEVMAVSDYFGVSVGYLFGETENPHQNPDGGNSVGPAGIEPTTSTVEDGQFIAPVIQLRRA